MAAGIECGLQTLRLTIGVDPQRRTFGQPDGCVLGRRFGGAGSQNHAMEQRLPNQRRNFDNPRIREKLRQITPQGRCGGLVRCTELHHQDRCQRRFSMGELFRRRKSGHEAKSLLSAGTQFAALSAVETRRAVMSTIGITRS